MISPRSFSVCAAGALAALTAPCTAQCNQAWFEPRTLGHVTPVALVDANARGVLEFLGIDEDGLGVWTLDEGPAPRLLTRVYAGRIDNAIAVDLDGDLDLDVALLCDDTETVRTFRNDAAEWAEVVVIPAGPGQLHALDHLGDGDTDVLWVSGSVEAKLLGNPGNGELADLGNPLPETARDLWTGNFNADARTDLIIATGSTQQDVFVSLQNPDGTFPIGPATGQRPGLVADIDGDGLDDMVDGREDDTLAFFRARGDGSFAPPETLFAAPDARALAAADLDLDGDNDLIGHDTLEESSGTVIYRNDGALGFTRVQGLRQHWLDQNTERNPGGLVGDLDLDGVPDLVGVRGGGGWSVLRGVGDATFHLPPSTFLRMEIRRMTTGDLDGDGDLDVIVRGVFGGDAGIAILRNDSAGRLDLVTTITFDDSSGNEAPALADLDDDGDLDIAFRAAARIVLVENTPDGRFSVSRTLPDASNTLGVPLLAGQFDADTLPDLLYHPSQHDTPPALLLRNLGAWRFEPEPFDLSGYVPVSYADVTDDGIRDILGKQIGSTDRGLAVFPGVGGGRFGAPVASDLIDRNTLFFFPGDFDGDGVTDLLANSVTGSRVSLLRGTGAGRFEDRGEIGRHSRARGIGVADFNNDGFDDYVAGAQTPDAAMLVFSNGDGTFADGVPLALPYAMTASPADMNGDGVLDIVALHSNSDSSSLTPGRVTTLLNQCGPFPCPVDLNADTAVDSRDVVRFLRLWAAGVPAGDWDGNAQNDTGDVSAFLGDWAAGCP